MAPRSVAFMLVAVAILGAALFATTRREPEAAPTPRAAIWSIDPDTLRAIAISLPAAGKREAWIKGADGEWSFDTPNPRPVDAARWGGGIPLLLSGPKAYRTIATEATAAQLASYGLSEPRMTVDLLLEDGGSIAVDVGDSTPDGSADYVRRRDSAAVYSVHGEWRRVLEKLVLEPPHAD